MTRCYVCRGSTASLPRYRRHWSRADDALLAMHWKKLDVERIAVLLQRTVTGVWGRAWKIKLAGHRKQRKFLPAEDAIVISMRRGGATAVKIGARLGRSKGSIISRWHKLPELKVAPRVRGVPSLPRVIFLERGDVA